MNMISILKDDKCKKYISIFAAVAILLSLVASIGFGSYGSSATIATIGKEKITAGLFERIYRQDLDYVSQMLGHEPTEEQIKMFRIKQSTLNKLINITLMQNLSKDLDLKISDENIMRQIASMPYFVNQEGKFDSAVFLDLLKQNNINEEEYLYEVKQNTLNGMIQSSYFTFVADIPKLTEQIFARKYEKRIADVITMDYKSINEDIKLSTQDVKTFYEKYKSSFRTPEYRAAQYFLLSKSDVTSGMKISADEVEKEFDNNREIYSLYAPRDVVHMIFETEESAREFIKELDSSDNQKQTIKNWRGKDGVDIKTSYDAHIEDFPDELRQSILETEAGKHTQPIASLLGWHVVSVKHISQMTGDVVEQIKHKIKQELLERKTFDYFYNKTEEIHKELQGGKSLSDMAKQYNVRVRETVPVDKEGFDQHKQEIPGLEADAIKVNLFKISEGETTAGAIDSYGKQFMFMQIKEIVPPIQKTLETVYDEAAQMLAKKEKGKRVKLAMEKMRDDVLATNSTTSAVRKHSATLSTNQTIYLEKTAKYENPTQKYPSELVKELFNISRGNPTHIYKDKDGVFYMAYLRDIIMPSAIGEHKAAHSKLNDNLNRVKSGILKDALMEHLKAKYPIKIMNEEMFK